MVVEHLHGRLRVEAEPRAVNKVHGSIGKEVTLRHGQGDVRWRVPDGSGGVDPWSRRAGGGQGPRDPVDQREHHVTSLQTL